MPRKYSPKKYKPRRARKVQTTARIARTALKKVNRVIKAEEVKKADTPIMETPLLIDYPGLIFPLTGVSIGNTQFTRIGAEVLAKYLSVSGIVKLNPGMTLNASAVVRFLFFIDRQEQMGVSPNPLSILEDADQSIAPYSRYTRTNAGRFQILRDFKVLLNSQYPQRLIKTNISFRRPHKIRYNASNSTDVIRGSVFIMVISDQPTGSSLLPIFQATCRFGYTDD
nr:MAG: putative capsid protein [Cressdnaviricota sp.]